MSLTELQRAEVARLSANVQEVDEYTIGKLLGWRHAAGRGTDDEKAIDAVIARAERKRDGA